MGLEEEFNEFIKNWCAAAEHLLDDDGNDGERFREKLRQLENKVDLRYCPFCGSNIELESTSDGQEGK